MSIYKQSALHVRTTKEGNLFFVRNLLKVYFDYLKKEGKEIIKPTIELDLFDYSKKLVLRISKTNYMHIAELAKL